jgi:hypothetical protein
LLSFGIAPHSVLAGGTSLPPALHRPLPSVTGGGTVPLTIRTAPRAAVQASLDVVVTQVVTSGKGAHRKHITRRVVLYHTILHGSADAHGRFNPLMHVAYQPSSAVVATLSVRAQARCSTVTQHTSLTILPLCGSA